MTPEPLNLPFIGITMSKDGYNKVKGLLPTPSYIDTLHSRTSQNLTLIYTIEGYITSSKQYKWLSDIKLGLRDYLFVPFEYVGEFHIHCDTVINGNLFSLQELHNAFKVQYRKYPRIFYPETKKNLYRSLLIHGKKLRHQQLFTMEAMLSAALMMNYKLKDKLSYKELYKNVKGAYQYILENQENFRERLNKSELKEAHRRGAAATHKKRSTDTYSKIIEALNNHKYFKANREINKTLLAQDLDMNRNTIAKYLKSIVI